ncbi:MAG: tRNA (adenosine(37)-N6)-threonylcarbamoyltransferase complex ATPase subunit type 1 TsaE [Myxococcales bacterium]|nr:tRNA (adenosine(37)-N6)-threonylcarbamoyltransferase complex ATPase subunit type 1 TsaE [Myxococcales bacterium]
MSEPPVLHDFGCLDEEELRRLASRWAERWGAALRARGHRLLGLDGPLGAGKTTFVQSFVRALPGGPDQEVSSPTYALVHVYGTKPIVRHLDLYRVSGPREVEELDAVELFEAPGLVLIEWFERCKDAAPANRVELSLEIAAGDRRNVKAVAHGQGRDWMEELK